MKARRAAVVAAMATMMGLATSGCGLDVIFGDGDGVGTGSVEPVGALGPDPMPYLGDGSDEPDEPDEPYEPDTCGRSTLMTFEGQMVDMIPPMLIPPGTRVYESGSPLTMDFRLDRINIEYAPITRDVVRITCG